jgi:hypothetical protein
MHSNVKGHVSNEAVDVEGTDLEAGQPPLLVGDIYDQLLQKNPFQDELPEDLPINQYDLLLFWLLAASVMSVMMFDSAPCFAFLLPGC